MNTFLSILVGIGVACFFFRIFFGGWDEFFECLSLFVEHETEAFHDGSGEYTIAILKLGVYFALSIGSGIMTHYTLLKHFG